MGPVFQVYLGIGGLSDVCMEINTHRSLQVAAKTLSMRMCAYAYGERMCVCNRTVVEAYTHAHRHLMHARRFHNWHLHVRTYVRMVEMSPCFTLLAATQQLTKKRAQRDRQTSKASSRQQHHQKPMLACGQ